MINDKPLIKYFERRTDFELNMKNFFNSINFIIDKDYEFLSHMFVIENNKEFFIIDYDLDFDHETDLFNICTDNKKMIVSKNFDELISNLSKIKSINIALRKNKLNKLL